MPTLVSPWIRGRRGLLARASLGFSLHQACEAAVPIAVGIVIDVAISGSDAAGLAIGIGLLAVVFAALLSSWRMGELAAMRLYVDMDYAVRRDLLSRVLDPAGRARRRGGEALSLLTSDVSETASVAWILGRAAAFAVAIAVAAAGLLAISVPLGITVLVTTPLLALAVRLVTRPLERRSAAEQAALADSSAIASDLLTGLRTVKGLRAEGEAIRRFERANAATLATALRAGSAEGVFSGVSALLSGAFLVVLAVLSSSAALDGTITVGQLVTVIGLAQFLQWPLTSLAFTGAELATVRASRRRIEELASGVETSPHADVAAPRGAVRIVGADGGPLAGLALDIAAGEFVGVDADEERARALEALLGGVAPAAHGTALVDGEPLRRPPSPGTPRVVSAPHDAAILTGTVADNVGVRDRDDIAAAAALTDVLAVDGWDRAVGERGRLLSGGQRQRVALARALASDAVVLALREPTTAVDAVTESRIASGIRGLRSGRTTILLTRSRALLAVCDRVVTADDLVGEPA
ncbi:ABC transporter transmembrane domain-containing protein [Microbacterium sp. NPDC055683]